MSRSNLPSAYIFDIDGTVACTGDRLHLIQPPPGEKKQWGKFFKESEKDPRFEHLYDVYTALRDGWATLFFVTARPEDNREITEKWLEKHNFTGYKALYMRPSREHKADYLVKKDIYYQHIYPKYNVVAAFEDRLNVAKMWMEERVPVFLCGDAWLKGDWSK